MRIQKTDWGHIEWLDSENSIAYSPSLKVGIVYCDAGKTMLPHYHYEEQLLYIIKGEAISYADGVPSHLEPGMFVHMAPGCTHEITDIHEPLVHIMVSTPQNLESDIAMDFGIPGNDSDINFHLHSAVLVAGNQFLNREHLAYVIRDASGTILKKSPFFPEFCEQQCQISSSMSCPCLTMYAPMNACEGIRESIFTCPYGLTLYRIPIIWGQRIIGTILGGYIRRTHGNVSDSSLYEVPESGGIGLLQLLRKISKAIQNYCEFEYAQKELFEREQSLKSARQDRSRLEHILRDTEHTVSNLRINNHFLFNTLNSMASMALEGGQNELYHSIIDLSKMLRYSVRIQESMIPLSTELDYLESYLKLQKLRFPSGFLYETHAAPELSECMVPFNFLQPIIENAFTHGFARQKKKRISLRISKVEQNLHFLISNNGTPLSASEIQQIHFQLANGSTHGLSILYGKLNYLYPEHFSMRFLENETGVTMELIIPQAFYNKEVSHDPNSHLR